MTTQARILDNQDLLTLAHAAILKSYNRQIPVTLLAQSDPYGYHLLEPLIVHEHAQGAQVPPHMRCMLYMKTIHDLIPRQTIVDVPMDLYNSYPLSQAVMDKIQRAKQLDDIMEAHGDE